VGRKKTGAFSTIDTHKMERMLKEEDMKKNFLMYPF
jgi:hypothetical protein